jgi:hypothetical protein
MFGQSAVPRFHPSPLAVLLLLYRSLRSVYRRDFITDFSRVEGVPVRG